MVEEMLMSGAVMMPVRKEQALGLLPHLQALFAAMLTDFEVTT